MTAPAARPEPAPGTAVAAKGVRELAPEDQARIDAIRARNLMVAAIRSTQWGNNLSAEVQRAVAEYCRQNNLDPVRHVEILGGRIYLTGELYDEKGAPFLRAGVIVPDEPDYVNADDRLDALAAKGDAWAIEESTRRLRARIRYRIPEAAKAAVVQRFVIAASGATIVGVNWCGGVRGKTERGKDADPIGEAEPAKTAQTRARRRAWKQVAEVIPGYAEIVQPLQAAAAIVNEQIPVSVIEAPHQPRALVGAGSGEPYADDAGEAPALALGDRQRHDALAEG